MRAAVLGAGYAGVAVARRLEESLPPTAELVVVDDTGTHLVQHELHRLVRRPDLRTSLEMPLDRLLDRARIVEGRVTDLDADAGTATVDVAGEDEGEGVDGDGERPSTLDGDGTLSFDAGAVALGAETAFYGLAGVREHATPLKRIEHAEAIREEFLAVCEAGGRAVVGGAGLSGVQVAGELAALADERVPGSADEGGADVRVTLLEQEDAVAPQFPPSFRAAVRAALERNGVEVRTGHRVAGTDDATVALANGTAVEYDQLVWTGGIRAPPAVGDDRPVVRADLRLGERAVGVGDVVRVVDANGDAVPASAQAAVRQAPVAATNVGKLLEGGDEVFGPRLERFTFESPGWIVSVGDDAVAKVGPTVLTGRAATALKASVGAGYFSGVGAVENAIKVVNRELGLEAGAADVPDEVERSA